MDYVLATSLRHSTSPRVVISYEAACKWRQDPSGRLRALPVELHAAFRSKGNLTYVVPQNRLDKHGLACRTRFSSTYLQHMGNVSEDTRQSRWGWLDATLSSTRHMPLGVEYDTIDDQCSSRNWRLLTSLGRYTAPWHISLIHTL